MKFITVIRSLIFDASEPQTLYRVAKPFFFLLNVFVRWIVSLVKARTLVLWPIHWHIIETVSCIRGPLHGTEIVGRPLSDQKWARYLNDLSKATTKNISVWDPCALIDLSAISPSGWKNLTFIERSLRGHWEIDENIEHSLSVHWVFIERSLSIHWEIASLGDYWEIVLDCVKTLRRLWQPWRSLNDHWEIVKRSWRLLSDRWVLVERSSRDLATFSSLNDLSMIATRV